MVIALMETADETGDTMPFRRTVAVKKLRSYSLIQIKIRKPGGKISEIRSGKPGSLFLRNVPQ